MLRLLNLNNLSRGLMAKEFDTYDRNGTLMVPDVLSAEGREWYSSIFRDAVTNFDEEWLAEQLLAPEYIGVESTAGENGTVGRPVDPSVIEAFVKGEFNRLYCRAVCRMALDKGEQNVIVYQAEDFADPVPEYIACEGRAVPARPLYASLEHATLDDFLELPPQRRQSALCVKLPDTQSTTSGS